MSTEKSEVGFKLDAKQAVGIATKYAIELYGASISNLLLEEVELVADDTWHVTLSFSVLGEPEKEPQASPFNVFATPPPKVRTCHYKVFLIDAQSGKVRSMKIRKNA